MPAGERSRRGSFWRESWRELLGAPTPSSGYDAFLSYAHADLATAAALQGELETLAKPWYRSRQHRIFRDEASLPAAPGLRAAIEAALARSDWLIVLASPAAAASPWVDAEVRWWLGNRPVDRLLIGLVGGEIVWSGPGGGPDRRRCTALPAALLDDPRVVEPGWVDLRGVIGSPAGDALMRDGAAELLAAMRGVGKDEIVGRHLDEQRRRRRVTRLVIAGLSVLLVAALLAGVTAVLRGNEADEQGQLATARQLAATATALADTDLQRAQLLAAAAYRLSPADPQTYRALSDVVGASPHLVRYVHADARITAVATSADGGASLLGTEAGQVLQVDAGPGPPTVLATLAGPVTSVDISDDGRVAAAADGTRAVVGVDGDLQPAALPDDEPAGPVSLSADGNVLGVLSKPAGGDGSTLNRISSDGLATRSVSPIGWTRLATTDEGELVVSTYGGWERRAGADLAPVEAGDLNLGVHTSAAALSADGRYLTATNGVPDVPLWALVPGTDYDRPDRVGRSTSADPEAIALNADGSRLAVAHGGTIYVSSPAAPGQGAAEPLLLTGNNEVDEQGLAMSADGAHLVSANGSTAALWDLTRSGRAVTETPVEMVNSCNGCPPPRVWSQPDGGAVAVVGSFDARLHQPDPAGWRSVPLSVGLTIRQFGPVVWSPATNEVLVVRPDSAIVARDAAQPDRVVRVLDPVGLDDVVDARLTPDGAALVAIDKAGTVLVREVRTGTVRARFDAAAPASPGRLPAPGAAALSADAGLAARVPDEGGIEVIDIRSGRRSVVTTDEVDSVAFVSGQLLVQRVTGELELRDVGDGRVLRALAPAGGYGPTLAVDPVGRRVARLREDGAIELLNVETGTALLQRGLVLRQLQKAAMTFNADGSELVVVTEPPPDRPEGAIARWTVSAEALLALACSTSGRDLTDDEWTLHAAGAPDGARRCGS